MKKAIVGFFSPLNRQGTIRFWALLVFGVAWAMIGIGVTMLVVFAGGSPSLVASLVIVLLGLGLYVASCFGWAFPARREAKGGEGRKIKSH